MGFELTLHAITPNSDLLRAIDGGEIDPDFLAFIPGYRWKGPKPHFWAEAEYALFANYLDAMLVSSPGIDRRTCDLDRRFEWLQWILVRIEAQSSPKPAFSKWAVSGEKPFTPAARSVQGFTICWSKHETCLQISQWLARIDSNMIRSVFDLSSMKAANLYKLYRNDDDDHILEAVSRDFGELQSFYREVALHREAVLAITD